MLDKAGTVLYVGKAKNLKKRVLSYFTRTLDTKTAKLVSHIHSIEVTVTPNEREALLLENNLIKEFKPHYNVLFRDDKSYAYLLITKEPFPRLSIHRGAKTIPGRYFGPYINASQIRDSLFFLHRAFMLRNCENTVFKSRLRPCLEYQLKRCSAPCVHFISETQYAEDVKNAELFLEGKNYQIIQSLASRMEEASQNLEYERATVLRDQIAMLRKIQESQSVIVSSSKTAIDVLGVVSIQGQVCIHVLHIRDGRISGSQQYFSTTKEVVQEIDSCIESFILQTYGKEVPNPPKEIVVQSVIKNVSALNALLQEQMLEMKVVYAKRQEKQRWMEMALQSARQGLELRSKVQLEFHWKFESLQKALDLQHLPKRIECFDISHTMGEATVGVCVAFDVEGAIKSSYRRYNVRAKTGGDDYAALKEVLERHCAAFKEHPETAPDILLIDGGKMQLKVAETVLQKLQIEGLLALGIAKGEKRKVGLETIYLNSSGDILSLKDYPEALQLLQYIRDEAHRFAITGHRRRKRKLNLHSVLEDIPGIGKKRRKELISQLGGYQELQGASIEEIAKVPGISKALAERIYGLLHEQ